MSPRIIIAAVYSVAVLGVLVLFLHSRFDDRVFLVQVEMPVRVTFRDGPATFNTIAELETRIVDVNEHGQVQLANEKKFQSHLINCMKATAPLMSSEDQGLFMILVRDQLTNGLYQMRRGSENDLDRVLIVVGKDGNPKRSEADRDNDFEVLQLAMYEKCSG